VQAVRYKPVGEVCLALLTLLMPACYTAMREVGRL
jgi:hypothetical protein